MSRQKALDCYKYKLISTTHSYITSVDIYVQTFSLCVTCEPAAERHRDRICANNRFLHKTETSVCKIRHDVSSHRWRRRQWRTLKCQVVLVWPSLGCSYSWWPQEGSRVIALKINCLHKLSSNLCNFFFFFKQPWSNFKSPAVMWPVKIYFGSTETRKTED